MNAELERKLKIIDRLFELEIGQMILGEDVLTCSSDTKLRKVVDILVAKNIGSIVITDNKKPIGIFTERDLMKKIVSKNVNLDEKTVGEYMTPKPISISTDSKIRGAMSFMRLGKFRHLVVTEKNGDLKSVISVKDVLVHLVDTLNEIKEN